MPENLPLPPNRAPLYPPTPQQGSPLETKAGDEQLPQRLTAYRIRSTRFPIVRRGYDPQAVHEYLSQVADELLQLHQQLAWAHDETDRIKRHLRQWQTDHAATCHNIQGRRTRTDWPINR